MASKTNKETKWHDEPLKLIGWCGTLLGVCVIPYYIGVWKSGVDHKMEIIEINQKHNTELTNLKIEYDNKVIELKNELNVYKISIEKTSNGK